MFNTGLNCQDRGQRWAERGGIDHANIKKEKKTGKMWADLADQKKKKTRLLVRFTEREARLVGRGRDP